MLDFKLRSYTYVARTNCGLWRITQSRSAKIVYIREIGKKISWLLSPFAERREVHGEVLDLIRISRTEMGAYLCIAQNGVPPSISKRIILTVECEYHSPHVRS